MFLLKLWYNIKNQLRLLVFLLGAFCCQTEGRVRNLKIHELEALITERVLCDKLSGKSRIIKERFTRKELLQQGLYALNDLIRDFGLNDEIWARVRGEKVFLFHERSRRLLTELVVDAEYVGYGIVRRPSYLLLGKWGFLKERTVADLILKFNKKREIKG